MLGFPHRILEKGFLLAAVIWCGFLSESRAQNRNYTDQLWQVAEGLPNGQVRAITQCADGFLWVGTIEGLARFDGANFTVVERHSTREMIGQLYIALAEAADGSIWFSNGQGLSRHQGKKTTLYTTNDGLPGKNVMVVFCDPHGDVIVGTEKGVCKFQNGKFVPLSATDPIGNAAVRAIIEDKKGNLWLGTSKGLFKSHDGQLTSFTKGQGHLRENSVFALAEGSNGAIWIGTSAGLTRFDGKESKHFSTVDGLLMNTVRTLYRDKSGSLWIGTAKGVQRLVNENLPFIGQITSYPNELPDTGYLVYTIFEDNEENIWIGTNRGLIRLRPERFKVYSVAEGLPHRIVYSVCEDSSNRVWVGTVGGVARIEKEKVIPFLTVTTATTTNQIPKTAILSLMEDEQRDMWFATKVGVYRWRTSGLLHYTAQKSKLADDVAQCMLQLTASSYWFGHKNGVTRYRFQIFTNFSDKVELTFRNVKALAEGKENRVWVGSADGLTVLKGEAFKRFTMKDGLSSEAINALYVDAEETLWIGTEYGGLDRFKNGRVTPITPAASGIFSERIYSIVEDDCGNLWMSSRHGIFRAAKKELNDFADGKISSVHCVSYGKADGLRTIQCSGTSQPSATKGKDGRLWFATLDGVAVIDPRNLAVNRQPPKIALQNITVDGQPFTASNEMRLPPGKGNVQFEYTGICLQAPEKVRFKYMLEGVDTDWTDAGTRRIASYANLPPRTYRFLIRAGNNDEVWSKTPASFAFTVTPHFYQRTSVYVGAILLFGATLIGLHYWRVRAHALREKELSVVVARRTQHLEDAMNSMETFTYSIAHDLRAPLRAIRGMTTLLIDEYGRHLDQKGRKYSDAITESAKKMDALLSDLLIYGQVAHAQASLQEVELESTLATVCSELDPQIQARKAVIDIAKPLLEVKANVDLLRQVLINLVSNGIKFVAPEKTPHLRIWTEKQKDKVRIFVADNGIGIDGKYQERIFWLFERLHTEKIYPGTGVGLAIVQKAVERMGGNAGVQSEFGKGSCFWVEFPAAI